MRELITAIESGQPVAVATIVRRIGSSPRDVGARMLIYQDGTTSGTIGGGKFEYRVIQDGLEMFGRPEKGRLVQYRFSKQGEHAIGMTCGGEAEVFIELFHTPSRLLVFGGGHVGRELTRLAAGSNFLVTVIDDRPDILEQYEGAINTHQSSNSYQGNLPDISPGDYIVIVTRSHESDLTVLQKYIDSDCSYLGMMGSRAKIARLFERLRQDGVSEAQLERVHAPIGADIGAEGPYEIAISILAELISVINRVGRKAK